MRLVLNLACVLSIIFALSSQGHGRVIGFPLHGVRTNIVEYDLPAASEKTLMEGLTYATSVEVMYSTSDPEADTVFFHGFPLNSGVLSLIKVDLQSKTVESVPLISARNSTISIPFYHSASKSVYDLMVVRNRDTDKSYVALFQVDFNTKRSKLVKKYSEMDSIGHAVYVSQGTGSIIATAGFVKAPGKIISIDLATGEYKTLPDYKIDGNLDHLRWLSFGLNADGASVSILSLDDRNMIDGQRNMTVVHWDLASGVLSRVGEPFLFPPKDAFFTTPQLSSTTFDVKLERFYAAFSDHSSASGIIAVDATTGKQAQFATYSKWSEPREITLL